MKIRKSITKKDLINFCKGQFFSDSRNSIPWEPFENYSAEEVRRFAGELADNLEYFLREKSEA